MANTILAVVLIFCLNGITFGDGKKEVSHCFTISEPGYFHMKEGFQEQHKEHLAYYRDPDNPLARAVRSIKEETFYEFISATPITCRLGIFLKSIDHNLRMEWGTLCHVEVKYRADYLEEHRPLSCSETKELKPDYFREGIGPEDREMLCTTTLPGSDGRPRRDKDGQLVKEWTTYHTKGSLGWRYCLGKQPKGK